MRKVVPVLLVALAVAGQLLLTPAPSAAQISDQDLGMRVAENIRDYSQFTVFDDVNIQVENRVVTLTGRVMTPRKKDDIGKRVAKIDGVRTVVNNIGVLPVSRIDDSLRRAIATAIYEHPAFWTYSQQQNPPIHIIVEGGNVTLTGVVDSQTQKQLALSLAHVGGQMGVTNRLRVSPR